MVTRLLGFAIPTALLLTLGTTSAAGSPPGLGTTSNAGPKQPHPSSPQQPHKPTTSPASPHKPTTGAKPGTNTGMTRGLSVGRGGYGNQLGRMNRPQSTAFTGQDAQEILPPVAGVGHSPIMGAAPSGQTAFDAFDAQIAAYLQQVQGSQYANATKTQTPAATVPTSTDLQKR